MEPEFLALERVLKAHSRSLAAYGGSDGIRDQGLLESAVTQPKNDYFYGNADLFGVAAAYAFHIAQAQAFIDGNKRTAIATALVFLELNNVPTTPHHDKLYDAMIAIAEKRLAALFRELFAPR